MLNYKKLIIDLVNETDDMNKLKLLYRIIKRYLAE